MERVIAYIDGYNLYHGLRDSGWKRLYWLNIKELVSRLLNPNEVLVQTNYFTSIVKTPESKRRRQQVYLEALRTLSDFQIRYGHFMSDNVTCRNCGYTYQTHHEKMTDVNIAIEMIADAYNNRFDAGFLISADSDLSGVIASVHTLFRGKRIVVIFPPSRHSDELKRLADGVLHLDYSSLLKSMFPEEIQKPDGFILRRPLEWSKNVQPSKRR